jgi:hypothetical protein
MQAWVLVHVSSSYQIPGAFPTERAAASKAADLNQRSGDTFKPVQRLVPKNGYWPLSQPLPIFLRDLLWNDTIPSGNGKTRPAIKEG